MDAVNLLQAALVPVVLISAIGILNFSLSGRYARVHDRIRHILHDIEALSNENKADEIKRLKTQIDSLLYRGNLLKTSIFFMQLAIVIFIVDSLLLFLNSVYPSQMGWVVIIVFACGMLIILISSSIQAAEIITSRKYIKTEVKDAAELADKNASH